MGSPRKIKEEKVARFQSTAEKAKAIVLADYKGLTVKAMEDLRRKVREIGGNVIVIKNTLAAVALKGIGADSLDTDLSGQIAFVFSIEDAVGATKIAQQFARENKAFNVVSGYFDGHRISLQEVEELASMPSREELKSRFVGILIAPMAEFIGTLTSPLQDLIGTFKAQVNKDPDFTQIQEFVGTFKAQTKKDQTLTQKLINAIPENLFGGNQPDIVTIKTCIQAGLDVNQPDSRSGVTPLDQACTWGYLEVVKLLVEAGADVNQLAFDRDDLDPRPPLQDAVEHSEPEVVSYLLSQGANINAVAPKSGRTTMEIAKKRLARNKEIGGRIDRAEKVLQIIKGASK